MNDEALARTATIQITNPVQFREALSRLRELERSPSGSVLGRERTALELAVSRYLSCRERPTG
jgi:hypothetical protein